MQRDQLSRFKGGWFIGNFTPTIRFTTLFEAAYKYHAKGEHWPAHYQEVATEYNLLTHGRLQIKHTTFHPGDLFIIEPGEIVKPHFLTNCEVMVIKTPSLPGDKILCK